MTEPARSSPSQAEFEAQLSPVLERAYATALRLTRHAADAEDLVQDAALLAFRGFATFERGTNFRAWFLRILMNAFLSGRRKHRVEDSAVSLDELPNVFIQRQAHELVKTEAVPSGLAAADVVRGVIVPVGTVRSRLHRGRALLQKRLWETARDHGLVPARGSA
jgi:RNA polymerase sigma-70 factor (ECF subfamily)